jgi:hypothetical protein
LNTGFYYEPLPADYYTYTPFDAWDKYHQIPEVVTTDKIASSIVWINANKENKEDKTMKTLYRVFVVTNKGRIIIRGDLVIATNREEAAFNINLHPILKDQCLKLSEVTVLFEDLGKVKVEDEDAG